MTVPLFLSFLESLRRPSRALALGGHRTVKFDQVATKIVSWSGLFNLGCENQISNNSINIPWCRLAAYG